MVKLRSGSLQLKTFTLQSRILLHTCEDSTMASASLFHCTIISMVVMQFRNVLGTGIVIIKWLVVAHR